MLLPSRCESAILIRRYKRFLADVELDNGTMLTVHCPNSGSMLGCSTPGSEVIISYSDNPKRKYAWTLEMIREGQVWIGVHTGRTNAIVREGLEQGIVDSLGEVVSIKAEVVVSGKSRLDFFVETKRGHTYLEVKNCSLAEQGEALFPDAVTARGAKHLHELVELAHQGFGAALLFCVQREDAVSCRPAHRIDPVYGKTIAWAQGQGVQIIAYQARVNPSEVTLFQQIPFHL